MAVTNESTDLLIQLAKDKNEENQSYLTIDEKNFLTPDMGEYIKDNVPLNYFKNIEEALDKNDTADGSNAMFYVEEPYSKELGYHPEAGVFIIKSAPIMGSSTEKGPAYDELNRYDGDTVYFTTEDINDGDKPFEIGGMKFNNFREYIGFSNVESLNNGFFGLRFLGINAPEIPHYDVVPYIDSLKDKLTYFTIEQIEGNPNYAYDKTQGKKRKKNKKYPFIKISDKSSEPWHEVLKGAKDSLLVGEDYKPDPENITVTEESLKKQKYYLIVTKDDSEMDSLYHTDGIKAKNLVCTTLLQEAKEVIIQIDGRTISQRSGKFPKDYDDDYYMDASNIFRYPVTAIQELWKAATSNVNYKYLGYNSFGQDNYRRYLGTIYVKMQVGPQFVWINLSKYLMTKIGDNIEPLPDYTSDPLQEAHYGFASDAFKLWTYKANDGLVVDSLMTLSKKDFDDRRKIQKEIMGVDFEFMKDYTMMLGDSLFMVPPTSVRVVTQTSSERLPLLRGRGSMVKSSPKSERVIELSLYFNNDGGINGVPYSTTLPNGKEVTYHMNGLRSLIAMFKLTPFLPIENHYINNILQIEAVSLVNIQISTMPNYPRCLAAVLTLQEFNYLVYMPELPKPNADKGEHLNKNIFASSINYELMRYYYQRPLIEGQQYRNLKFDSSEYLDKTFGSKTVLFPMDFKNSGIEFYITDKDYLEQQLQLKLAAINRPFNTQPELTESGEDWKKELAKLFFTVSTLQNDQDIKNILTELKASETDDYDNPSVLIADKRNLATRFLDFTDSREVWQISGDQMKETILKKSSGIRDTKRGQELLEKHADALQSRIEKLLIGKAPLVTSISMKEAYEDQKSYGLVKWKVLLNVSYENLTSSEELQQFFDYVAKELDLTSEEYMEDGKIVLYFSAKFESLNLGKLIDDGFVFDTYAPGYKFLQYCANASGVNASDEDYDQEESEEWDKENSSDMQDVLSDDKQNIDVETIESLKFKKYPIGDVNVKNLSAVFGNTMTKMNLQALDGYAPQYAGGQDTVIEIAIETMDENAVLLLNNLPKLAANYAREYKLVLPCWPIRINSEITKLLGVNEVLIESVDTNTVPSHPGLYSINLRLVSVDRTMRNREALRKIEVASNAGFQGENQTNSIVSKTFFDIKDSLAKAEIYPDLELPTLRQLEEDGFKFIRYSTSKNRVFPDPDFYFTYGHVLGNEIFRNSLLHHLNGEILEMENNTELKKKLGNVSVPNFEIVDKYGAKVTITPKKELGYSVVKDSENQTAKTMMENRKAIQEDAIRISNMYRKDDKNAAPELLDHNQVISALANTQAYEAWDVSDSIRCMFREKKYETAFNEKDGYFVKKIDESAQKIIDIIDAELSKPFSFVTYHGSGMIYTGAKAFEDFIKAPGIKITMENGKDQQKYIKDNIDEFVKAYFQENNWGKQILEAFKITEEDLNAVTKNLSKMLLSAAAAASGSKEYGGKDIDKYEWQPKAFVDPSSRTFVIKAKTDADKRLIPICIIKENLGQSNYKENVWASNIDKAVESGVKFGTFMIKKYNKEEVEKICGKTINTNNGSFFLDPYYGQYAEDENARASDEEVIEYKKAILISPHSAAYAFMRNGLVFMKKMLEDKILYSLYDMVQQAASDNITAKMLEETNVEYGQGQGTVSAENYDPATMPKPTDPSEYATPDELADYSEKLRKYNEHQEKLKAIAKEKEEKEATMTDEEKKVAEEEDKKIKEAEKLAKEQADRNAKEQAANIKSLLDRSRIPLAMGKVFVPILLALTNGSNTIYSLMKDRNYSVLNDITRASQLPSSNVLNNLEDTRNLRKFLLALAGYGIIKDIGYIGQRGEYLSEYMDNIVNEKIYIAAAENPMAYIQHSFYDMIMNDKRGRMLRAFPTYYMMFIDEGREIGLWKLHDNFYNMSALSEIQVVKSRKIAADTANITMSNMFKSYTTDDEDQKEGYQYDWKDAFTSIFSPRIYYMQEETKRINAESVEKVRLQPGARIHLRMGYGADASSLPILFNGSIAEVGAGDVVNIVAQGDGVELTNPILTTSDAEDVQHEDRIIVSKQWNKWLTKGATPRTILGSILTTKGGWFKKTVRNITNGRFFSENPYGIVHFGDPEYKRIFPNGEVVQNLYEALPSPSWEGKTENYITEGYKMDHAPKISTQIFGKSYWDIMHICASVEPDFITSVVPFGMRSSIFYGAPRYYYAYDYEKGEEGQILEKRKPFQQYHIYTSYSDIIANTIKASEKDVKTCAVGMYSKKGWLGKESAGKVGPLWADFDIYPEKQKTMTVDTQFIAKGTAGGDVIPFLNWLQNDLADDEGSIQGGYQLAWRMTASALKNSIKDMYQGELIVLGDPSIKPYDKVYLHDIFERMQGAFDVEAVVHNFTVENGYTTSVYADCITTIDDRYERISQHITGKAVAQAASAYGAVWFTTAGFSQQARPLLTAMLGMASKAGTLTTSTINNLAELVGKEALIDNDKFIQGLKQVGNTVGVSPTHIEYDKFLRKAKEWSMTLGDIPKNGITDPSTLSDYYEKMSKTMKNADTSELVKSMKNSLTDETIKLKPKEREAIEEAIKELVNYRDSVSSEIIGKIKLDTTEIKEITSVLEKYKDSLDTTTDAKRISEVTKMIEDTNQLFANGKTLSSIDELDDFTKILSTVCSNVDDAKDLAKITDKTADIVKGAKTGLRTLDKAFDANGIILKASKLAFGAKAGLAVAAIGMALEFAITAIVTGYVYEYIERWMKNLQVVQVFPLKKDGRVLTAGLNGSKGIVVGSPTEDDPGAIEGWIGDIFQDKEGLWGGVYNVARDFIASADMKEIAERYRRSESLPEPDSVVGRESLVQDMLLAMTSDEIASSNSYQASLLRPRIRSLASEDGKVAFKRYAIKTTDPTMMKELLNTDMVMLSNSEKIKKLEEKDYFMFIHKVPEKLTALKEVYDPQVKDFTIGENVVSVPVIYNKEEDVLDMPFLRPDAYTLLIKIIDEVNTELNPPTSQIGEENKLKNHKMVLRSALRANSSGWASTGLMFRLQVTGFNTFESTISRVADEQAKVIKSSIKENTGSKEFEIDGKIFAYKKIKDDTYDFMVYPTKTV